MTIDPTNQQSIRPRRLRRGQLLRDAFADVSLTPQHCILPLFLKSGTGLNIPVASMPGVSQMSPDVAAAHIKSLTANGLNQFMLFGVIDADQKDEVGSAAFDKKNPVNQTLRLVREQGTEALLYADLCFCEYTSHGHCGTLCCDEDQTVDNDKTLEMLAKQALVLCESGVDVLAPSGMMDGVIGRVRKELDGNNYQHIALMSYCIKYASNFYGPFRDAGDGSPSFGDRKGYQMDYRRSREWQQELALDLAEGADMIMIKPAMAYLDIIAGCRGLTSSPIAAYHVSGEYSMLHAAAEKGYIDLKAGALESLYAIRRAGADQIVTYFADDLLDWL